jgi:adenylate cyclase
MNKRIPIFLGFLFVVFAVWLHITAIPSIRLVLLRLEHIAYDMEIRTQLLTHPQKLKNSPIAIIDVDDRSLYKEGRWPWPRSKLAVLIDNLQAAGAVVVAFDMIFPQEERNIVDEVSTKLIAEKLKDINIESALKKIQPYFNNDAKFALSMSDADTVIGISFVERPIITGNIPPPLLPLTTTAEKELGFIDMAGIEGANSIIAKAAKNSGFINVFPDSDGIIRRVPILLRYQDGLYPSLALEAVRVFLLSNIKLVTAEYGDSERLEGVQIGDYTIPTDAQGQVIIPFIGKGFTYPYFSATDVLNNKIPAGALGGKIVFVGASAIGLGDLKATAVQNPYPGVEVHATIAEGILKKNFPFRPAWSLGAEIFLGVFLGLVLTFICPYLGPRILTLLIVIIPVLLIFANNYLREKTGLIIGIFIPIAVSISIALLNLVYGYLFETRRREHIKEMFGQYVPEEHINEMLKSGYSYGLYGEDRDMTVLFADIRNFTSISEPMGATQLKNYLSAYLNPITEVIFKYRGTIDKYVGDMVMAFWGAPLADKKHAQHALDAALAMQHAVTKLNLVLKENNEPLIQIGIGINSGMMSVGDMGSKFRRNYTVLGDAVNLGSRVEGLTKYYGVKIMATEMTIQNQKKFLFRLLDRVRVKGKDKGVAIYEVVCKLSDASEELKNEILQHEHALNCYLQQKWDLALELFSQLNRDHPHSKLYTLYLERIAEFMQTPPPRDWDGVYSHTHK